MKTDDSKRKIQRMQVMQEITVSDVVEEEVSESVSGSASMNSSSSVCSLSFESSIVSNIKEDDEESVSDTTETVDKIGEVSLSIKKSLNGAAKDTEVQPEKINSGPFNDILAKIKKIQITKAKEEEEKKYMHQDESFQSLLLLTKSKKSSSSNPKNLSSGLNRVSGRMMGFGSTSNVRHSGRVVPNKNDFLRSGAMK